MAENNNNNNKKVLGGEYCRQEGILECCYQDREERQKPEGSKIVFLYAVICRASNHGRLEAQATLGPHLDLDLSLFSSLLSFLSFAFLIGLAFQIHPSRAIFFISFFFQLIIIC